MKLKEDLKAEGADKAKIEKEFEAAKQASLKAKEEFDAARIKASQFVKVKDSVLTMEKPSAFIPPVKEQGHVHVELDKTRFDKDTGEKLSKAYIQIFTPRAFKDFKKNTLGFKVQVIWDGETFKSI